MRTGKADFIGKAGGTQLITVDAGNEPQEDQPRTEPVALFHSFGTRLLLLTRRSRPGTTSGCATQYRWPLDFETINETYMQGWADTTPTGHVGRALKGYFTPFEEWPEEIKQYYRYDPKGAEALLDEAGYPRGADGIRFQTVYPHYEFSDLDYYQIVMEYLRAIGIGIEVKVYDRAAWIALVQSRKNEGLIVDTNNNDYPPLGAIIHAHSTLSPWPPKTSMTRFMTACMRPPQPLPPLRSSRGWLTRQICTG